MIRALSNNENHSNVNYVDLQKSIDELVGKHGLEKAVHIIQHFSRNAKIPVSKNHRLKLITEYIVSQCIEVFDLEAGKFNTCTVREYREARMACYHLLKKFTGSSYARIGQRFGWKLHTVYYFCQKCDEILSIPQFYKSFADKYSSLEGSTISFISKLK